MADERIVLGYTDGATVSVEIKRQADGFRYDWDDATFKDAGWVERQHVLPEDATTPGLYEDVVDPATWEDGEYALVVTDAAITPPIRIAVFEVASGQFAAAPGVARAVAHANMAAVNEDALYDGAGIATTVKLGTVLMNHWQRLYGKVVLDRNAGTLTIYKANNTDILAVLPVTDVANVQTIGPAAAP